MPQIPSIWPVTAIFKLFKSAGKLNVMRSSGTYRVFRVLDHEENMKRMKLQSMVPLSCGTEYITQRPLSALERPAERFENTISPYTRNVDCQISTDGKRIQHKVMIVETAEHKATSMTPLFTPQANPLPDPCSYDPNIAAQKPRAPNYTIQPKRENVDNVRKKELFATGEIVSLYTSRLRDFDPDMIKVRKMPELEIKEIKSKIASRPLSGMSSVTPRDAVFRNHAGGKHLDPYEIPYKEKIVVPDLGDKERVVFPIEPDKNIKYDLAVEQRDKLRTREKTYCWMKHQKARDEKPKKNKTVDLLDRLKREQRSFMEEIRPKTTERCIKKEERPKSSFAAQKGRVEKLWPDEKVDNTPEEILPYDPIKSFHKTQPRVRAVVIGERPKKPLSDVDFWKPGGCHVR